MHVKNSEARNILYLSNVSNPCWDLHADSFHDVFSTNNLQDKCLIIHLMFKDFPAITKLKFLYKMIIEKSDLKSSYS